MKEKITIANAWIFQVDDYSINPVFGDIHVEKGKITRITQKNFSEFFQHPHKVNPKSFNAGGRVITTPLVNFHEHIYSRLAKGLPVPGPMNEFQQILQNLWWNLDRALDQNMINASAKMAALESIRNGVTYIFDHHSSPEYIKNSLCSIAEVLLDYNLRGVLCFETTDRNDVSKTKSSKEENMKFYQECTGEHFRSIFGLHASFTLSDDTLEEVSQLINDNNLGIHIHLCEDISDREISKNIAGALPVARLKEFGLLNNKSILSHGVHLTKREFDIIEESNSAIALNPDSNMNNGVGLPLIGKIPIGIPLLCGTDGMHADIKKTMKTLFLLYRHLGKSFEDAFKWFRKIYFDQYVFVKRYFDDYPSLQINDRADFILWDYIPPTPLNKSNIWGHFIYGMLERPIHSVVSNGSFLMKNYELININEIDEYAEIHKQGRKLFEKFKKFA